MAVSKGNPQSILSKEKKNKKINGFHILKFKPLKHTTPFVFGIYSDSSHTNCNIPTIRLLLVMRVINLMVGSTKQKFNGGA